ncbi:5215_t:CDS:2 [Scutellospora calospora]|uniref:5215_t:CDS:1 n=1 Tax=Scutellospora calospora TaxID=85575 RepID=A0ACA9JTS9_9GLOM|nr:5215_t:CDS:2 [Scutellospora calospora]
MSDIYKEVWTKEKEKKSEVESLVELIDNEELIDKEEEILETAYFTF